jgi:hypothetical protein
MVNLISRSTSCAVFFQSCIVLLLCARAQDGFTHHLNAIGAGSIDKKALDEAHQSLTIDLPEIEFKRACNAQFSDAPNWFLVRRNLVGSKFNLKSSPVFKFHNSEPIEVVDIPEEKRLYFLGDMLRMSVSSTSAPFTGYGQTILAKHSDQRVFVVVNSPTLPILSYSAEGNEIWKSKLLRLSGYRKNLELEVFEIGDNLIIFTADFLAPSNELTIQALDKRNGKSLRWWSSWYDRLSNQ